MHLIVHKHYTFVSNIFPNRNIAAWIMDASLAEVENKTRTILKNVTYNKPINKNTVINSNDYIYGDESLPVSVTMSLSLQTVCTLI